jgi:hypothetical protein
MLSPLLSDTVIDIFAAFRYFAAIFRRIIAAAVFADAAYAIFAAAAMPADAATLTPAIRHSAFAITFAHFLFSMPAIISLPIAAATPLR